MDSMPSLPQWQKTGVSTGQAISKRYWDPIGPIRAMMGLFDVFTNTKKSLYAKLKRSFDSLNSNARLVCAGLRDMNCGELFIRARSCLRLRFHVYRDMTV